MMSIGEPAQREAKRRFVAEALRRIGKLEGIDVAACVPSPSSFGYRNKLELAVGEGGTLGFRAAAEPATIVDVAACAVADPRLGPALAAVRSALRSHPEVAGEGGLARVGLRVASTGSDLVLGLHGGGPVRQAERDLARAVFEGGAGITGVVRVTAPPDRRGGAAVETLHGRGWLEESLLGTAFRVAAASFLQINGAVAEQVGRHVLGLAGRPRTVVELYGGAGAIAIALARAGASADVVEADADAVAGGREAAARAGLDVRFVRGDVGSDLAARRKGPDLVVADPPRTGLGRGVAAALGRLAPPAIVMVSCDPATLARDLAALAAHGYAAREVVPFDMFPQTAHVEAVALLTR